MASWATAAAHVDAPAAFKYGFDYRLDFNDWYQYLGPKTRLYADELSRANSGSGMPQIDDLWRDFGDPSEALARPCAEPVRGRGLSTAR